MKRGAAKLLQDVESMWSITCTSSVLQVLTHPNSPLAVPRRPSQPRQLNNAGHAGLNSSCWQVAMAAPPRNSTGDRRRSSASARASGSLLSSTNKLGWDWLLRDTCLPCLRSRYLRRLPSRGPGTIAGPAPSSPGQDAIPLLFAPPCPAAHTTP